MRWNSRKDTQPYIGQRDGVMSVDPSCGIIDFKNLGSGENTGAKTTNPRRSFIRQGRARGYS